MELNYSEEWSCLARYQEELPDGKVRCLLCPHECVIQNGKYGNCRTRFNREGTLYSIAYGNPCSISIDPIEKKPLFHFYPGTEIFSIATAGCNFHCKNCQNWQISQSSPNGLEHYDMMPKDIVNKVIRQGCGSIAFTYTEPTVFYEYMLDIAKEARKKGIKNAIVSNGYINAEPLNELCEYIDAANIDLKCFDDGVYRRLIGGTLNPVLETLMILKEKNVWLEITTLLVPGYSDEPDMIKAMCGWLVENGFADTPLHFSRFFPTYKLSDLQPTSRKSLIQAGEIAKEAGISFVYIGNIPELHGENTYCPECKSLLIERTGFYVKKNILNDGKCPKCGKHIPGVWS